MDNADPEVAGDPYLRALAGAIIDISADIERKSLVRTGVKPLPHGLVDILRVVETRPGITVAEVASRLSKQLSNVSVQLKELVDMGLVSRARDPRDKRYVELRLTPEARDIKARLEGAWAEALQTASSRLEPGDREQILECLPALQRLAQSLGEPG
jgi:DNA-binding MarR family transcriptional regulator